MTYFQWSLIQGVFKPLQNVHSLFGCCSSRRFCSFFVLSLCTFATSCFLLFFLQVQYHCFNDIIPVCCFYTQKQQVESFLKSLHFPSSISKVLVKLTKSRWPQKSNWVSCCRPYRKAGFSRASGPEVRNCARSRQIPNLSGSICIPLLNITWPDWPFNSKIYMKSRTCIAEIWWARYSLESNRQNCKIFTLCYKMCCKDQPKHPFFFNFVPEQKLKEM